ncbi:hypothetical protein C0674_13945 [Sporolactobacillus terrae]|uniref:Transposase IS204/IS1001/IS1096/IS1165 zinc-finger domain-containing protein n=1 Tax=Sporolactobacillus terrae TaxID=269673 RepID=A0ABX5QAD7_9BACL|nr:hypothetical protein C0674_13945 [Sporolactobacillus terrae]QAA26572.1 hypothetical protein C0679_13930 [Sporolactobacillus terrae]
MIRVRFDASRQQSAVFLQVKKDVFLVKQKTVHQTRRCSGACGKRVTEATIQHREDTSGWFKKMLHERAWIPFRRAFCQSSRQCDLRRQ